MPYHPLIVKTMQNATFQPCITVGVLPFTFIKTDVVITYLTVHMEKMKPTAHQVRYLYCMC